MYMYIDMNILWHGYMHTKLLLTSPHFSLSLPSSLSLSLSPYFPLLLSLYHSFFLKLTGSL